MRTHPGGEFSSPFQHICSHKWKSNRRCMSMCQHLDLFMCWNNFLKFDCVWKYWASEYKLPTWTIWLEMWNIPQTISPVSCVSFSSIPKMQQNSHIWQPNYSRILFVLLALLFIFGIVSNTINWTATILITNAFQNILFHCILDFCSFFF